MRWAVKVSLDHRNLVHHEVEQILQRKVDWVSDSVAIFDSTICKIRKLAEVSASVKYILVEPFEITYETLLHNTHPSSFELYHNWIDAQGDVEFRVTHSHLGFHDDKSKGDTIEKNIGAWIWQIRPNFMVNLKKPKFKFLIFSSPEISIMGWCYQEIFYSRIAKRAPKFGPYFQGGNMKPRMCRLVVNLLQPLDPLILDPFAGHGGILREAADQGSFCIGFEINRKVMREFLANNRHFGYEGSIAVLLADALHPPLRKSAYNSAVTDPPYAIQTTTNGIGSEELITRWLDQLGKDIKIVFTAPDTILQTLPSKWMIEFDALDYVHGGLTRRIRKIGRN